MTATASSFRVEVHAGGQLLAAYPAPFEAAAGSLATEVVRFPLLLHRCRRFAHDL